jgi:hypothetical protein
MESEGHVFDELNVTQERSRLSQKMLQRKETVLFSAYLFVRDKKLIKEKRVLITHRGVYILRNSMNCCKSTGLYFAKSSHVSDFRDITVNSNKKCMVLHCVKGDDLFVQLVKDMGEYSRPLPRLLPAKRPSMQPELPEKTQINKLSLDFPLDEDDIYETMKRELLDEK